MLYGGRGAPGREDERDAFIIVLTGVMRIANGNQRAYCGVAKYSHVCMMHHIAYITLVGYGLYRLLSFYSMLNRRFKRMKMLVRIHHSLPCYKTDQYDPGKTDMEFFLFQLMV
ncbi:hypothetical protein Mucpa_3178 [Mucilaginibacter paludis DSM 18603]|uniref:Uncharacterized protein n=1 Tax=Mucilaginibacter paludis DSM 18603 TaxID=714943 RepID=H1YFH4_9SPHI|nr:hypothetical protein Mucpa_3178 [Mucilaginibacter paludis DSM 18603]